jgi:hypothetical protein
MDFGHKIGLRVNQEEVEEFEHSGDTTSLAFDGTIPRQWDQ